MRARVLRAEWVKFRTVRGWVIAVIVAGLAIIALGVGSGNGHGSCNAASCQGPTGPGGELVTDSFYFVRQPLPGDGSITVRVTSLTGEIPSYTGAGGLPGTRAGVMPWSKAGIIVKASTAQGSAYAAMMVTGGHGVRMQDDYTGDIAGLPGSVSAGSPRWLRLTRSGDTVTGYDSADGTRWRRVGTVRLAGLPATAQAGLFATSPQYAQTDAVFQNSVSGGLTQTTGTFDHVGLTWPGGAWTGADIGAPQGPAPGPATGFRQAGGRFSVTGSGDIAPAVSGPAGMGTTLTQVLIGTFAGLIVIVVIGAMFMTAEYRRGLIRVTLAATPRRGQVLAAKAAVVGAVTFAVGLAAAAITVIVGQRELRADGVYVWAASGLTQARVIVGTAAVLAVAAVIAVALGAVLRRSAAAVASVIVVLVLPYLLTVAVPILPPGPANWLDRITPAAAFAVQQTAIVYPQVDNLYIPAQGFYPLAPWAGFAVLCGWAVVALGVAAYLLRRRDA
jgi:ABC-type transport system involved in multi-copper enzyme maturation permease subunit